MIITIPNRGFIQDMPQATWLIAKQNSTLKFNTLDFSYKKEKELLVYYLQFYFPSTFQHKYRVFLF